MTSLKKLHCWWPIIISGYICFDFNCS